MNNTPKQPTHLDEAVLWLHTVKGSIFYSESSAAVEVVHGGRLIHKEYPISNSHDARAAAMMAARAAWEEIYARQLT